MSTYRDNAHTYFSTHLAVYNVCECLHTHLKGHLIFGHIAQNNQAFFLGLSRAKAEFLCRAVGRKK